MRLRSTAFAALFLFAPLAACGGGGGANADDLCERSTENAIDELLNGGGDVPEDFDDEREAIAVVAAADDGVEEEAERVTEFLDEIDEALEGVDRDDDEEVEEALEDLDADDFLEVQEDLVELAEVVDEECDTEIVADFEGEGGDDGEDEETTTTEGDGEEPTTTADDSSGEDTSLEDFADLVESCEDGNMADCDQLFFETPVGSEAEDVGRTCGGLGDQTTSGQCEELFG